jgi:DNA-binding beta-propeller fold protein YncE
MLPLLLGLALLGCDSEDPGPDPFDPDAINFDEVASLDYGDYVQPLLAARNVFSPTATDAEGDLDDYEWDDFFGEAHDHDGAHEEVTPGETIIPFDAEASFLIRFVEDLADDVAIPYPNLRTLQDDEVRYLKRWIEDGARNDDGDVPYADSEHLLYAAVQGANYVAIIDAERWQVIRNVYFDSLGLGSAPNGPHYMVFEPDRSAVYVSLINANTVVKISGDLSLDPTDPSYVLATSPAFTTPGMMALDHERGRLYVGRSTASSTNTFGIGVFDPETMAELEQFNPGFDIPHALGLTPDGLFLLTAPLTGDRAVSLCATDECPQGNAGDLVSEVPVGGTAELVHFSVLPGEAPPYTATLTANPADSSPDEVLFFAVGADGALSLDGAVATGGERAWHAHLDRDGETVIVPNRASNSVSRIHVPSATAQVIENPSEEGPLAMPYSPGPTHAGAFFVSNSNLEGTWAPPYPFRDDDGEPLPNDAFGNVTCIDPDTGEVLKVILLGHYPSGLEHWHAGGHDHDAHEGGHDH